MKVAVLINNFNYGEFLDECLKSLESQSVLPDEVILYDDGSSDNSLEIAGKYKFVKIISNINFGKKPAFNQANAIYEAFKISSAEIICLLDSDDYFHPDKISSIKNAFLDQDVILVQNAFYQFHTIENKIYKNFGRLDEDYVSLYRRNNWTGYFNATSCLSFRRSYLEKQLPIVDDSNWVVWSDVRLSRIAPYFGKIKVLSEALTYYRRHSKNDSSTMNINHQNTLRNQIAHHEFVNAKLAELQLKKLDFRSSIAYYKFKLKALFYILTIKFFYRFKS